MGAGHFDTRTAYAGANTLRIDDMNPHFWRTHDGGKTWTEIDSGIDSGAVANSIREDPRQKGLLYAATETQVWVSFDDGAAWQSLRRNMPAVSVRDLQVKDDSTCLCADLIAGTPGRASWILDALTPLRQEAAVQAAQAAGTAYLVKPVTAVRVRFGTNDPTPWPPEVPAGQNPPRGALLDYYLPAGVTGPVTLDIVSGAGKVIRSYSSEDPALTPDPALDPDAYNQVCQQHPEATDCGLPLYWPAPQRGIGTGPGMHRVTWDMRYEPINPPDVGAQGDVEATGAVPHESVHNENAPWAPPGRYSVRLTVGGKRYTQPLALRLDPRVRTPVAGITALVRLTRGMDDGPVAAHTAYGEARALVAELDKLSGAGVDAFKAQVESLAPAPRPRARGFFFRRGPSGPPTLESVSTGMISAAMAMQGADVTPTAMEVAACDRARAQSVQVMPRWTRLKTAGLAAFNARRKAAGLPTVTLPQ